MTKLVSLLLIVPAFLLFSFNDKHKQSPMGMDYSIVANKETSCDDNFPDELSYFLEAIGGYGSNSEVAQVSAILHIDLNAFQQYDTGDLNRDEEKKCWQSIDAFTTVVDKLLAAIAKNPAYYKKVKYGQQSKSDNAMKMQEDLSRIMQKNDTAELEAYIDKLSKNEALQYPVDRGYLSKNRITADLKQLKKILTCYKSAGATKIKMLYG